MLGSPARQACSKLAVHAQCIYVQSMAGVALCPTPESEYSHNSSDTPIVGVYCILPISTQSTWFVAHAFVMLHPWVACSACVLLCDVARCTWGIRIMCTHVRLLSFDPSSVEHSSRRECYTSELAHTRTHACTHACRMVYVLHTCRVCHGRWYECTAPTSSLLQGLTQLSQLAGHHSRNLLMHGVFALLTACMLLFTSCAASCLWCCCAP